MKTIGLIGGMSWESSQEYYRIINQEIRARLGGTHSAKSLMWSMDFGEIERLQHEGRWDELTALMIEAAQNLERGGADFILICTNTMHKMADDIESATSIPPCAYRGPHGGKDQGCRPLKSRAPRHRLHDGTGFL